VWTFINQWWSLVLWCVLAGLGLSGVRGWLRTQRYHEVAMTLGFIEVGIPGLIFQTTPLKTMVPLGWALLVLAIGGFSAFVTMRWYLRVTRTRDT
jgi:hypothetical protein